MGYRQIRVSRCGGFRKCSIFSGHFHTCVCPDVCMCVHGCVFMFSFACLTAELVITTRALSINTLTPRDKLSLQCLFPDTIASHQHTTTSQHSLSIHTPALGDNLALQGGENSQNVLSCRSFFAKKPPITGLFFGK